MRKLLFVCMFLSSMVASAQNPENQIFDFTNKDIKVLQAVPFSLKDVKLLDSRFKRAMDLNAKYLLDLEPDRLLSRFREYAGLQPKAKIYGGWEAMTISGHTLGHYLSALGMQYAASKDERFAKRADYILDELIECQKASKNGALISYPNGKKAMEEEVAKGIIRSQGFDLNGVWVPWYTTHKVLMGLYDVYVWCQNPKAKEVMIKLSDWSISIIKDLSDAQMQEMMRCEHGGMIEALAHTYKITGDKKYLDAARKFNHTLIMNPLSERKDELSGKHSNTNIPKVIGAARMYELTNETYYQTIANFFWQTVVDNRTYVNGGNADGEYFYPYEDFDSHISKVSTEKCCSYNMLKLSEHLFQWKPSAKIMDYYERTLYNHIITSQDTLDGMFIYYTPTEPGNAKSYTNKYEDFPCCLGTGLEDHTRYGAAIYFHTKDTLYANLFIPSELTWTEKGVKIIQTNNFPEQETTTFEIKCKKTSNFAFKVRYPFWAKSMEVKINGKKIEISAKPSSYAVIKRKWKNGDKIEIRFGMELRVEPLPNTKKWYAFMYGPMLLAADFSPVTLNKYKDLIHVQDTNSVPVLICKPEELITKIKPVPNEHLTFYTDNVGTPCDVVLIPYYKINRQRFGFYFESYTTERWKEVQEIRAKELQRIKELNDRSADIVQTGEQQPEVDHAFKGEKTSTGEWKNRKYRQSNDGGWFSYDMKVFADKPNNLMCNYWGSERKRTFDIYINDTKIATQVLDRNQPNEFFDVEYPISADLVKGKTKVTVKFVAHEKTIAGGIYNIRIVSPKK